MSTIRAAELMKYFVYLSRMTVTVVLTMAALVITVVAQVMKAPNESPISLETRAVEGRSYSAREIPVEVVFKNRKNDSIRLLNIFDDPKTLRSFFRIDLRDDSGTPINTIGGGKISLSKDSTKYIDLNKDAELKVNLELADFLPTDSTMKAGTYTITVTYQNQYGDNCFKGTLISKPISLYLSGT